MTKNVEEAVRLQSETKVNKRGERRETGMWTAKVAHSICQVYLPCGCPQ